MKSPDEAPPPRRYTSPTGRVVIPILVVVLLIFVLGRPILVSGLGLEEESDAPVPAPGGRGSNEEEETSGPKRIAVPYPKACMRAVSPQGFGLVAAAGDRGSIGVGSPTGQAAFALRAQSPVGFSASGLYLGTAGGDLWSATGAHLGLAFKRPVVSWAWSPAGDCLVGIERGRLMFVRPENGPKVLVRGVPVSDFAFSPDGKRLIFVVGDGSSSAGIWMADLASGETKRLLDVIGWSLTAWSRAARPILLQEGAGSRSRDGLSVAPADEVAYCGSEVITVEGGRLATFGVREVPSFLDADRRFRYLAVGCSPDEELLIVVRQPKAGSTSTSLAVLETDGPTVEELAVDTAIEDFPMWGPPGTGVIFAASSQGGEPLVWFLPEGGQPRQTGLRVARLGDGLDALLDWSATPPVGHPTN
jgi:hypothetical protein